MGKYLGKDSIKDIVEAGKVSPLGTPVMLVSFDTERDLVHKQMDEIRERQNELLDQRNKAKGEEQQKVDDLIEEYAVKEGEIDKLQDSATDIERTIYATQTMLDACQTEDSNDNYYTDRRIVMVGKILEILAEYGTEKVEIIPILQLVEQSTRENELKATGKLFGKDITDINLLDYHYAILNTDTN